MYEFYIFICKNGVKVITKIGKKTKKNVSHGTNIKKSITNR